MKYAITLNGRTYEVEVEMDAPMTMDTSIPVCPLHLWQQSLLQHLKPHPLPQHPLLPAQVKLSLLPCPAPS